MTMQRRQSALAAMSTHAQMLTIVVTATTLCHCRRSLVEL
jgi:hypothetical protein